MTTSPPRRPSSRERSSWRKLGLRAVGSAGLATGIVGVDNLWASLAVLANGKPEDPQEWTAVASMCAVGAVALATILWTSVSFLLGLGGVWVRKAFLAAALLEMVYFVLVFVVWVSLPHEIASTISSTSGLGSIWLMPQIVTGFPIWGPCIILWARSRSIPPTAAVPS